MPRKSAPLHLEPRHKEDIKPGPGFINRIQNVNQSIKKKNQQKTRRDSAQRRRESLFLEKTQQKSHDGQKMPTLSEETSMITSDWGSTQVDDLWRFPILQDPYTMSPEAIHRNIPSQESSLEDDCQSQSYQSIVESDMCSYLWPSASLSFPYSSVSSGSELYADPWAQSIQFENINSYEGPLAMSQPWDHTLLAPLGPDYDPMPFVANTCSDGREDATQVGLETDLGYLD